MTHFLISDFSFFLDSPPIVKIVWTLAAVFFIVLIFFILYLKILRTRLRRHEAYTARQEKKYEEFKTDFNSFIDLLVNETK